MIPCCKALDSCCQKMFKGCGMKTLYKILGECCSCCIGCCEGCAKLFDKPCACWAVFCLFLLGAGSVLSFIYCGKHWACSQCDNRLDIGLLIIGINYLVQNFTNFYTVFKYSRNYGKFGEFDQRRAQKSICTVTFEFLCYDFFMCFYIFFLPFSIVWAGIWIGFAGRNNALCRGNYYF